MSGLDRINALMLRQLYLYKRSVPRIMELFYWPLMELFLWGFLSIYLVKFNLANFNAATVLLGAIILWNLLTQSQRGVSIAFLEEVWTKNFVNLFVAPLRMWEFLASTAFIGVLRLVAISAVLSVVAAILYAFNIFQFGWSLIPFVANLLLFGWILGIFTTALIFRYGTGAQALVFGIVFLLQPISAVLYPVSVLPRGVQYVALALPSTHVFEGMRAVINSGYLPLGTFLWASLLNLIFLVVSLWFFYRMFGWMKNQGLLMKLE